MIEVIVLFALAVIWLVFASVQDVREQEVANWVSFSLIIFALGFRFFFSLFSEFGAGFGFFYQGLIGLVIFFILGNIFYYFKLFAGGDAKLLIALGTILPLSVNFWNNVLYFLYFIVIFLFTGAIYGFAMSLVLLSRNFNAFKKQFKKRFKFMKNVVYLNVFFALFLMILGLTEWMFLFLGVIILIMPFLYLYAKSVDESCAVVSIPVGKLREGDWLYEDVKLGKGKKVKVIQANWEGVSAKDIKLIQKKLKKVKIRRGIAFIPAMLISFILFMVFFLVTTA